MREKILKEFQDQVLDPRVNFANEFLKSFLKTKPNIKDLLVEYFKKTEVRYDGLKTFTLERWSSFGGDSNPTIEIVQIEDKFLFGTTSYGVLGPLKNDGFVDHKKRIMEVIIDFFVKPEQYLQK